MRKGYGFIALALATAAWPGAAKAQPLEVTITRFDCSRIVRYVPDAEVPADYVPGVDARGEPVAPADLYGGSGIELPEVFSFVLRVNPLNTLEIRELESRRRVLAARLADEPGNAALRAELSALDREASRLDGRPEAATVMPLGRVDVRRDGRVYFDGTPLQDDLVWELAERCRQTLRDGR